MPSNITYSELGQFLLNLGFVDESGDYLIYRHSLPSALVQMALHEPDEPVLERDLAKVGALLRLNGLVDRDEFEKWLLTAKQHHEAAATRRHIEVPVAGIEQIVTREQLADA